MTHDTPRLAQQPSLRDALENLLRCGNAIVGASVSDPDAAEAFEMWDDARGRARAALAPGNGAVGATTKSAPDLLASQNIAEHDPSVMPDWAGADTSMPSREALRDLIAKHQRCSMPCACLRNAQKSDCAALADQILAAAPSPAALDPVTVEAVSEEIFDCLYASVYADNDGVAGLSNFVEQLLEKFDVRSKSLPVSSTVQTCIDCGKGDPCDENCPNHPGWEDC